MAGPFPGMDPYLEDPGFWSGLHGALIFSTMEDLNAQMPDEFTAWIDEQCYVVPSTRRIVPDVALTESAPVEAIRGRAAAATSIKTVESADPSITVLAESFEMRRKRIEIRKSKGSREVITVIEILSPINKNAQSVHRENYLKKQREVLESDTHLLEIDLLRPGVHTLAPSYDHLLETCGEWDYMISLSRHPQRDRFEVWPCYLRSRLPRVAVPLTPDRPDLTLDIQKILNRCYDAGHYAWNIDYSAASAIPLRGEDAAWADQLLREKGLRESNA